MKCKHSWHYMVAITNSYNKEFGNVIFICDKCGDKKQIKADWIIKEYEKSRI